MLKTLRDLVKVGGQFDGYTLIIQGIMLDYIKIIFLEKGGGIL